MKDMRVKSFLEARTVALLIGLTIGLGIALHEAFFFVALLIALGAAIEWVVEAPAEHQHVRHLKLTHRRLLLPTFKGAVFVSSQFRSFWNLRSSRNKSARKKCAAIRNCCEA